nr:SRPBCC family protein [Nocardioides panaciterrulae]
MQHRFTVPTTIEQTWAHFQDIATVAECFPGATVSAVESDSFAGSVKVKLGPIALQYNGTGTFLEKDESAHRFVVEAKGKDKRGNGTAGATVTLTMTDGGSGDETPATDVEVLTDLSITGKPAQFGRGVMQDVSDKLLGQFVACLEARLTGPPAEAPAETPTAPAAAPAGAAAVAPAGGGAPAAEATSAGEAPAAAGPAPTRPLPTAAAAGGPRHAGPQPGEALDLGATVLPVLAKAYWKQGAAVLAVVALIWWLVSRRD